MKYTPGLLFIFILSISCGQNQTSAPQQNIRNHRTGLSEFELEEAIRSKVPISMVRKVRQTKNGDILIASYVGVYRYDGTSFTNLTSTIAWPTFWNVLEDKRGNLWLASQDSGVYCMPAGQASFKHFTEKDGAGITSALHIYEDRAGNIWFGSNRYDGKSFRNFTTEDGFPSNNIRLLLEDRKGNLWFGAQGENMFVYDGKTFTVVQNKDGRPFNNVWSIIEDKKGNIWFGDVDGLWRYDGSTFTHVSHRGAYAIIEDRKGNIWTTGVVNATRWALSRYDEGTLYNENPTFTEMMSQAAMLLGILEDVNGNIWFGSGSGVYRYDGNTITDFKSE